MMMMIEQEKEGKGGGCIIGPLAVLTEPSPAVEALVYSICSIFRFILQSHVNTMLGLCDLRRVGKRGR